MTDIDDKGAMLPILASAAAAAAVFWVLTGATARRLLPRLVRYAIIAAAWLAAAYYAFWYMGTLGPQ